MYDVGQVISAQVLADIAQADALQRRDCFARLKRYLERPAGKVMFLSGLRRTGKTILAKQGVAELPLALREQAVFLKFPYSCAGIPKNECYELIEDLYDQGYRYFFIDECTVVQEFPAWAKDIADGPAERGCHVVLLGTDSLAIWLAISNALVGRYEAVKTTRIPFHEWCRLLKQPNQKLSVDDYMHYGGILDFDGVPVETALMPEITNSFRDPASIEQYVYAAIALNIQNAIARNAGGPELSNLYRLWENGLLIEAIMRIVQEQNHRLVRRNLQKRFANDDFFEAYKKISSLDSGSRKYVKQQKEAILLEIEERLCLSHGGLELSKDDCIALENYLRRIDVFTDAEVRIMPSFDPEKRRTAKLYHKESRVLQTQCGIRSGQMQLACGLVWDILQVNRFPIEKGDFLRAVTSMVKGQLLEDIVFADLMDVLPTDCHIFKLIWDADVAERAEFDVAIVDERDIDNPRVSLIEVKYSSGMHGNTTKHLKNPLAIHQVVEAFGKIASRAVVYNGPTKRNAVLFVNANEFLNTICQNKEDAFFPQLAERWKPECDLESWMAPYQASDKKIVAYDEINTDQ